MSSTHSSPRGWDSIPPESAQTLPPSPNWQRYSHRRPPKSGRFEASSTLASSVRRVRSSERPCCPLAMRPNWPRRYHLPAWEIEGVRSRLRGGAYLGHDPADRLQQRLDVERTGYLTFDQLRRVVRLKLRVKTSDVSNEDLANLSYMLDFEDCGMVRVDDFVSFVLAEKQVLWRPTTETMKSKSLSSLATTQTSFGQTRGSRGSRGRSSSRKSGDSRSPSPTASTFRPEELARLRAQLLSRSGSPTLRGRLNVLGPLVPQELSFEEDVQRCCQSGNLGRLRVLLARGPRGQKPLSAELGCKCAHLAVHLGDEEICDLLLRAQVDPRCRAQSGATLLMRAALYGHKGIVKNLLTNWRANPLDVDEKGRNALHLACCSNLVTLQLLAEHSPRAIHATDKLGRGCFYYALANCKPDEQFRILQYLLYKRCDPNCPDHDAHNALWYALEAGNSEAVSLLLCAGADVDMSLLSHHGLGTSNPSNPCGCFECVARSPRDVTLGTDPDPRS